MSSDCQIFVNNLPVEFAVGMQLDIVRGSQPGVFRFLVTDPAPWKALKNPVTLKFITPGPGGEKDELLLEKWYIVSCLASASKMYEVTIHDCRWALLNRSFQGGWNIETADGEARGEKQTATRTPTTCVKAAAEALTLLGGDVPVLDVPTDLAAIVLPKNMGDSEAGGYVSGTLRTIELFLELCRCDMLPNKAGQIVFTDRSTDKTAGILKSPNYAGFVAGRDIHWTKPKFITTTFEQRIERPFDVNQDPQATALPVAKHDMALSNVAPDYDATQVPRLREDGSEIITWLSIEDFVSTRVGYSYDQLLTDFLKPTGVALMGANQKAAYLAKLRYEFMARDALFSTWKVDLVETGVGRIYMSIRLGRLGPKGLTSPGGNVFLDWTEYNAFRASLVPGSPPALHELSNTHLHDPDFPRPAPWDAAWVSDGRDALVFKLHPVRQGIGGSRLLIGAVSQDIHIGDMADVANGIPAITGDQVAIKSKFRMRVYWNALLASDVGDTKRLYEIKLPAFPNGEVDEIKIRASNVTANWGYDEQAGAFPGKLLNDEELKDRAKFITTQMGQTYEDAKSGVGISSGIRHLKTFWPAGNIYSASIIVGAAAPWEIVTRFDVMPEVRGPIVESRKDLDGMKPDMIG